MDLDDTETIAIIVLTVLSISFVLLAGTSLSGSGSELEPKSDIDGQQLSNATAQTIQDAGSYTRQTTTMARTNTSLSASQNQQNVTLRVDLASDRGIRSTNQSLTRGGTTQTASRSVYTDGNTSYRQTNFRGNTTYETQTGQPRTRGGIRPVNVTRFDSGFAPIVDAVSWDPNGTETVSGTETIKYTATNVTDPRTLTGRSNVTLSNVSGALWLDQNDVVRKFEISYTLGADGETRTTSTELSITNIGSTTVTEPGWVSQARATADTEPTPNPVTGTPT